MAQALSESDISELERITKELSITIEGEATSDMAVWSSLKVGFSDFLRYSSKAKGIELVNQSLHAGSVLLNKTDALKLFEAAMKSELTKGLPIDAKLLPKEIMDFSKTFKPTIKTYAGPARFGRNDTWWTQAPSNADSRHKTPHGQSHIGAYLVNTKGMSVDQATKIILEYIERCKLLDPQQGSTSVTSDTSATTRRSAASKSFHWTGEGAVGGALDINVLK